MSFTRSTSRHMSRVKWPTFTIGDWLVFLVGAAFGLRYLSDFDEWQSWPPAILRAVSMWFVVSLFIQASRLFIRRRGLAAKDQRPGYILEAGGRMSLSLLLFSCLATESYWPISKHLGYLDSVTFLTLVIALSCSPRPSPRRSLPPWADCLWLALSRTLITGLGVLVLAQAMCLHYLVYIACSAVEQSFSLRNRLEGVSLDIIDRTAPLFWHSVIGIAFLLPSVTLNWALARQWSLGWKRRVLWTGLLVVTLIVSLGHTCWTYLRILPAASPIAAQVSILETEYFSSLAPYDWDQFLVVPLLILMMGAAGAYRWTTKSTWFDHPGAGISHAAAETPPFHERIFVQALLAGSSLANLFVAGGFEWYLSMSYIESEILFHVSLAALALERVIGNIRGNMERGTMVGVASLSCFFAVWVTASATIAVGVVAIALFSFGVWFYPWYL